MNKGNVVSKQLLNRVLRDTDINLMDTMCDTVNKCSIFWTTYKNLKFWFENWLVNLEELGFVLRDNNTSWHPSRSVSQHSKSWWYMPLPRREKRSEGRAARSHIFLSNISANGKGRKQECSHQHDSCGEHSSSQSPPPSASSFRRVHNLMRHKICATMWLFLCLRLELSLATKWSVGGVSRM